MNKLWFALAICLASLATAGEPAAKIPRPDCLRCLVCPDDYCAKPWPCLPKAIYGGLCDDYCQKHLPHLPCPVPGVYCDDYCQKPWPCLPGPHWSPWLACPPSGWGLPAKR